MNIWNRSLLAVLVVFISACASYPEQVKVAEGTQLIEYQQVSKVATNYIGKQARWSGVIADIANLSDKTRLEVLFYPPSQNGRPITKSDPVGRFRVYTDKFLDPAIYKQGKSITALGSIAEKQVAKIDEYEYEYPTLNDSIVFLWPKKPEQTRVQFQYGWYGYHPSWFWFGGRRHLYIVGQSKPPAVKKNISNVK